MKVRNKLNIVFPKGLEFDKDIPPGEIAHVIMGSEWHVRLQNAIQSGSLEVVEEDKKEPEPVEEDKGTEPLHTRLEDGTVVFHVGEEEEEPQPDPAEMKHVQLKGGNVMATKETPIEDIVGKSAENLPREVMGSTVSERDLGTAESQPEPPVNAELAEFNRRNGKAKVAYVKKMLDGEALRTILRTSKGPKVRAAATARIEELFGLQKLDD